MKYLASHAKTKGILHKWAGGEKLVLAKHFFWNSGFSIQKSHVGLMQDLLCQILQRCPELIPFASTERWDGDESSVSRQSSWTRKELAASLENILVRGQLTSRFCFFIDGLDEYADEGAGQHHELIEYLDILAQSTQVKLCVSSRPWTVFKDRYEGRPALTLVLQDLTSRDMHKYVEGILNNDRRFRRLAVREPQALDLAIQIRDRAEGVFLWVYLVIRSLLKGLSEHDNTGKLQRRLLAIPKDLNEFFTKIFQNIDPVYQREAIRAFQLSTVAMPLPLMAFKCIPKEVLDSRYAFEMTAAELEVSDEKAKDDLNKWCRDLLEFRDCYDGTYRDKGGELHFRSVEVFLEFRRCYDGTHRVEGGEAHFLHKSVKDFLLTREMQTRFNDHSVCQSSPRQAICMMVLADMKKMGPCQNEQECHVFISRARELMGWAVKCEKLEGEAPTEILDELDRMRNLERKTWKGPFTNESKTMAHEALARGLRLYVGECLDRDPTAKDNIIWYISPHNPNMRVDSAERFGAMIDLLVQKGVNPNQPDPSGARNLNGARERTWELFLSACYHNTPTGLYRFAQPWIRHGADINCMITVENRRLDVRTCLLTEKGHWPSLMKEGCEREVDMWLSNARERRAAKLLLESSEPSNRSSLRAKFRRLLA